MHVVLQCDIGSTPKGCLDHATRVASILGIQVRFEFNDLFVFVYPNTGQYAAYSKKNGCQEYRINAAGAFEKVPA